jgi:hypothetical protein
MLYQFIGGPYKGKVSEEENYSDDDPPTSFELFDDDAKYPVPIFSFSYLMAGTKIVDGRKCFLYQYAARCDNLIVKHLENVSG